MTKLQRLSVFCKAEQLSTYTVRRWIRAGANGASTWAIQLGKLYFVDKEKFYKYFEGRKKYDQLENRNA